jgi:exopolysaccharide production protein ExoZ
MASIEAARALAAFAVVLLHAANLMRVEHFSGHIGLGQIFDFGYVGVDFFFVLSGFIITYVHFSDIGRIERLPQYLWRRFSRIYPIYWAILLFVIAVTTAARLATGKGPGWEISSADIAGTFFLLMGEGEPKYVGVAWSLQYEIVFYVAFCLLLINARIGTGIFIAWGVYVLAHALDLVQFKLPLQLSNAHCLQFLCGVMVGAAARRHVMRASPSMLVAALLAFFAAVVFEVYGPFDRHSEEGRIALGLASAAVLATLVALENEQAIRTPVWLARLGSVSYSIYLGHILFINLTYMALLKAGLYHALPEVVVFMLAVGVALISTALIGLYVELPLVNALKSRPQRRPETLGVTSVGH